MELFTVGHSNHSPEDFVALLRGHEIELLADVRRHPGSRHVPWTGAEPLQRRLGEAGIDYLHLPSLGGRRRPGPDSPNGGWRVKQFRGYADHMRSDEFAGGLEELEGAAKHRRTAVMCAEAQWWRCHRRLLADALVARGWRVLHLDSRGAAQEHSLTEFAIVDAGAVGYPGER